ncbi:MAG TPA: flagellar basal-body rod protein FlgG [Phycisphaerales bacterium]|nr:flagellar basal-body rod protein FlgG [Phycisphaerales bacterium]
MAINALQSAASGLTALNTALDVTANNLANVNTQGFKASRVNFQDLFYQEKAQPGAVNSNDDQRPTGLYVGLGVKVSGTQIDFTQGAAQSTGRPLDAMIEGAGFFQVTVEDSKASEGRGYTRAGNFALNADGEMVLANDQGRRLEPVITIPPNAIQGSISISSDGRVTYMTPGATEPSEAGQLQVATFVNPAGLRQIGENLYGATVASGPANVGVPAEEDRGTIVQGSLESSNVDPTRELIELIRVQRAFEMNSQSIKAADDTLRTVSQLRR